MIRIPIGSARRMRVQVRAVPRDANPYLIGYSIFRIGLEGETARIENLRQAQRYLPDNIYDALDNFRNADWTMQLPGEDGKGRYADLKQAAADRCPRQLGTFVQAPAVQYHHEVYNQFLWTLFWAHAGAFALPCPGRRRRSVPLPGCRIGTSRRSQVAIGRSDGDNR